MMSTKLVVGGMTLALIAAAAAAVDVTTDEGMTVRGFRAPAVDPSLSVDIDAFLGVPYAEPPLGALRWRPPTPLSRTRWANTVIDATKFGSICPQMSGDTLLGAEDCLSLNVWAPSGAKNLPVLVWIYGGGFVVGSTSITDYDPVTMMEKSGGAFVFVSMNYRLGPLGFFANAALDAASPTGSTGMTGIEDQRFALAWVRDNIGAFGGDPSRVTIQGESAGSISVSVHLISPLSRGLFHAAVLESGTCDILPTDNTLIHKITDTVVGELGCAPNGVTDVACLHAATLDEVFNASARAGSLKIFGDDQFGPFVDGRNLPKPCLEMIEDGDFAPVNIMLGSNHNEMALFFFGRPEWLGVTAGTFPALAEKWTGGDKDLIAHYDPANFGNDPRVALIRLLSERAFICSMRRLSALYTRFDSAVAYYYSFNHQPAAGLASTVDWFGAAHFLDVPFFFGRSPSDGNLVGAFNDEERTLSDTMMRFLVSMAVTGNPSAPLPSGSLGPARLFPAHTLDARSVLNFQVQSEGGITLSSDPYSKPCDLWDKAKIAGVPGYMDPAAAAAAAAAAADEGKNATGTPVKGDSSTKTTIAMALGGIGIVLGLVAVVFALKVRGGARNTSSSNDPKAVMLENQA